MSASGLLSPTQGHFIQEVEKASKSWWGKLYVNNKGEAKYVEWWDFWTSRDLLKKGYSHSPEFIAGKINEFVDRIREAIPTMRKRQFVTALEDLPKVRKQFKDRLIERLNRLKADPQDEFIARMDHLLEAVIPPARSQPVSPSPAQAASPALSTGTTVHAASPGSVASPSACVAERRRQRQEREKGVVSAHLSDSADLVTIRMDSNFARLVKGADGRHMLKLEKSADARSAKQRIEDERRAFINGHS